MADLSFDEAYETICPTCGTKAGAHRLTRTGNLYCLKLNYDHRDETWRKHHELYRVPVAKLVKSPLGIRVGAVIDYELHSLDNARVV